MAMQDKSESDSEESGADEKAAIQDPRRHSLAGSVVSRRSTRSANIVDFERKEKFTQRNLSEQRKSYFDDVRPPHSRLLSGWTSKGYYVSSVRHCPPGMEGIIPQGFILIGKGGKSFDQIFDNEEDLGNDKLQIFDVKGRVLFFAAETLQAYTSYPSYLREIDVTATGPKGGVVFHMTGTNKSAKVTTEEGLMGTISRHGLRSYFYHPDRKWSYSVSDSTGNNVCRFHYNQAKNKFILFYPGVPRSFGEYKSDWANDASYLLPQSEILNSTELNVHGLNLYAYKNKFNPKQKALILAAMILIHINLTRPVDHFGQNRSRFRYGFFYNAVIVFIIIILTIVVIVAVVVGKPHEEKLYCPGL